MEIDLPEVKAELEAVFVEYERALLAHDVHVLNGLFFAAPTTIRFGSRGENLYGHEEIASFRQSGQPSPARRLTRTVVTTYGSDFGVVSTLFQRLGSPDEVGRQMQTWIRTPHGWRVVAAHVSTVDRPDKAMF